MYNFFFVLFFQTQEQNICDSHKVFEKENQTNKVTDTNVKMPSSSPSPPSTGSPITKSETKLVKKKKKVSSGIAKFIKSTSFTMFDTTNSKESSKKDTTQTKSRKSISQSEEKTKKVSSGMAKFIRSASFTMFDTTKPFSKESSFDATEVKSHESISESDETKQETATGMGKIIFTS